jgi:hypothetical protein
VFLGMDSQLFAICRVEMCGFVTPVAIGGVC